MTEIPDVLYAKSGDVSIAYQVIGDGPIDVVFVRGFTGDLLSAWDQPLLVRVTWRVSRRTAASWCWTSGARGSRIGSRACRRSRLVWTT